MMQIARFRVQDTEPGGAVTSGPTPELKLWNYILENYAEWENEEVKPMYLTDRGVKGDISLIVNSSSSDALANLILEKLAPVVNLKDIWVFNMMEPRFFSVPQIISQNMKRYTLNIKVVPRDAPYVYESISKIRPSSQVVITYVSYIYHGHGDIILSLLAGDKSAVSEFTDRYIDRLKGVVQTEITSIRRSKNLANPEEWKKRCGQYFVPEKGKDPEDLEVYETWSKIGFE